MDNKRIHILLIEEEPIFSDRVAEILAQHYPEVELSIKHHFPNTRELQAQFPDIILLDPFQRGRNYEEDVYELKTLYPKIPVVFITENRIPEKIIEGFRLGITDYLLKPFDEEEFKRVFQRVLFTLQSRQLPALESIFQVCQQLNLCRSIDRFFYILALYIAKTLTSKQFFALFRAQGGEKFDVLHISGILEENRSKLEEVIEQGGVELLQTLEMVSLVSFEILPLPFRSVLGDKTNYFFVAFGNERTGKGILGFEVGHRPMEFITPLYSKIEELLHESEIIFSNLTAFLKVREMALKDDVTGLYNMRSFERLVEEELKASDKGGYPVSALFMDIDDFKKVNDTHGHLIGSRVLLEIADILRGILRKGELIFRYGGDEFVMILPATSLEEAKQIGERIRLSIFHHEFHTKGKKRIRLTVSIGVATYPEQARNIMELLTIADRAMYHGKKGSKDVVYVAEK